jgi:hypothetical protein
MSSTFIDALQLAKMGLAGGRQHFFAGGGQRYCAFEVTTVQIFLAACIWRIDAYRTQA